MSLKLSPKQLEILRTQYNLSEKAYKVIARENKPRWQYKSARSKLTYEYRKIKQINQLYKDVYTKLKINEQAPVFTVNYRKEKGTPYKESTKLVKGLTRQVKQQMKVLRNFAKTYDIPFESPKKNKPITVNSVKLVLMHGMVFKAQEMFQYVDTKDGTRKLDYMQEKMQQWANQHGINLTPNEWEQFEQMLDDIAL